ncbi:MAG: transketolase [Acidobacteria bacterium]|nr:transketolase [Acidobacteriota bacterium]
MVSSAAGKVAISFEEIVEDYRLGYRSRIASLIGRKEVLTGKAKFGIFGDGKEVPQLAMAKAFREGDFRAGYYRDQTFMFATGMSDISEFFAQLYANPDPVLEPASAGRGMSCHFGSRLIDEQGRWKPQVRSRNSSADISPTAGQMARLLGLAYASKLYRHEPSLQGDHVSGFSFGGNEVAFGTIGDASTSEGVFWEAVNAAGVLHVPMVVSVWDDGYGISVPTACQTTKGSISDVLAGFNRNGGPDGYDIYVVKGWDYLALCDAYMQGVEKVRRDHIPALFHITELTQPQGHSTSGSHERYKPSERLAWEEEHDCLGRMRAWMVSEKIATAEQIDHWEAEDRQLVERARSEAYEAYTAPIRQERAHVLSMLHRMAGESGEAQTAVGTIATELSNALTLTRKIVQSSIVKALAAIRGVEIPIKSELAAFLRRYREENIRRYGSHLYSESAESPMRVREIRPVYGENPEVVDGRVVLQRCFDYHFRTNPLVVALGEDVGKLGDVNLVYEGLNERYGDLRVTDTGIREATIVGQGIGMALRGLRPIVDIQYIDYLLYALQVISDDLATLHYRTRGGQKAPVIIRTKGHRLEGIWHTGSPMGMILSALRGLHVCVPRNMTQAAGFYATLLQADDPALVVEVLNGYRLKERVPSNLGVFTVPLGIPETIREGTDVTVVTYGACCRIAVEGAEALQRAGIGTEIIDVRTLLPFDVGQTIVRSLARTNAVLFLDEDVPGGASAFMMQQVLEEQRGYEHLDAPPRTLTARPHRAAYGTDGDYFCKPNADDVFEAVYALMRERDPARFPEFS